MGRRLGPASQRQCRASQVVKRSGERPAACASLRIDAPTTEARGGLERESCTYLEDSSTTLEDCKNVVYGSPSRTEKFLMRELWMGKINSQRSLNVTGRYRPSCPLECSSEVAPIIVAPGLWRKLTKTLDDGSESRGVGCGLGNRPAPDNSSTARQT